MHIVNGATARRDLLRHIWSAAMQPVDPDDPRPTYMKIAASIRAAILSGEFEPGTRLPTQNELAKYFGVVRTTIGSAIRVLQDEGFLRSVTGSGAYVSSRAKIPVTEGEPHPLHGVATFLHEAGHLKNLPRAGWLLLAIKPPESVAEHSFRVGLIGIVLASIEGADPGRTAALCLMHDVHETRIGDIPSVGRSYVTTAKPQAVTSHQTSVMPDEVAKLLQDLTSEYEDTETIESRVAHDADKVETLMQAREYAAQGYATEPWSDTSIQALRTESGKQLAQAIVAGDPHSWWSTFASSYHELRAATRARQERP
jgi:putative hydrolases of HD superfamily